MNEELKTRAEACNKEIMEVLKKYELTIGTSPAFYSNPHLVNPKNPQGTDVVQITFGDAKPKEGPSLETAPTVDPINPQP